MAKKYYEDARVKLRERDVPDLGTLKEMVHFAARRYRDDPAYIIPHSGGEDETKTFNDFSGDIDALGTALFRRSLKGCRIAILGANSYEWIVSYFAITNGGGTAIPLDRDMSAEDLISQVEGSRCAALIYAREYESKIPAFQNGTSLREYICMDDMEALFAQGLRMIEEGDNAFTGYDPSPDDLAAVVYTSGTTGKSKGVMLTQKNIMADAVSGCRAVGGGGCGVLTLPLHHTFGLVVGIIGPLIYGGLVYIGQSIRNVNKDMVKIQATAAVFVPAIVEVIYKRIWEAAQCGGRAEKMRKGLKISRFLMRFGIDARRKLFKPVHDALGGHLCLIVCGGAPLDEKLVRDFYAMGIDLLDGYGITECSPIVTANTRRNNKVGSVGLPIDCCRVRIAAQDEDGIGEIQVKGDNVMLGYYNDEQATKEAFTGDGWFKTGDLGHLDRDGYLYITGRIKHLIILSSGKNVSPEELEEKVSRIAHVAETAVYAADGRIVAEVFPEEGAGPEAQAEIRRAVHALNRSLPTYKQIGHIKFRDTEFPKTTAMKIKKYTLHQGE